MTTIENMYQQKCATASDIFEHLPTLRRYAAQCDHITELGVRTVVSTWAFLAGLNRKTNVRPKLVSVDIASPVHHGGNLEEVVAAAAEAGIDFRFIEADDRKIELSETDLLFIDTWHAYDQLKAELELHAGRAHKFIILHDTETYGLTGEKLSQELPPPAGLKQALHEFLRDQKNSWRVKESFTNCNGLTVLERFVLTQNRNGA